MQDEENTAAGAEAPAREKAAKRILYRAFPRHLLGAVPILYGSDLSTDRDMVRRTWTSLINSFLQGLQLRTVTLGVI